HRVVFGLLGGTETSASTLLITGASVFLFGLLVVEVLVSQRLWCRYLCPGGALYGLIGRFRAVRVLRTAGKCTNCADCVVACPMALNPMRDKMGLECDNCLACVSTCQDGALSLALSLREGPRPGLLQPTVSASLQS
ncbi:MAG: 4Fe-4S binding protein, partial [Phycisphaerae bacterium]|nr:4Fe-4S binding protein [Phycisphaerae bacterium]